MNWQSIVIKPTDTVFFAIEKIEKEASRAVLVVDDKQKLLGILTDGDVRRALIQHIPLESPVSTVMNTTPRVASTKQDAREIKKMLEDYDLLHIPVVDEQGRLQGLETHQTLKSSEQKENCVFLMAGGFGQRLRPFTDKTPKPLLKVGEKPILERILKRFIKSGFHKFYISLHYKAEMITDYFGDGSQWGVSIDYVFEEEPLGTAGALGLLPHCCLDKPVIIMNGDLLTKVNFSRLLDFHHKEQSAATLCVREYDFQVPYGVVKAHPKSLSMKRIDEKPIHKFFVNAGIYVVEPQLIQQLKPHQRIDMTELLNLSIENGDSVSMFPVHEYWLDIGRLDDYKRAQEDVTAGIF